MSKPFDASLSTLIDECPDDWARYLAYIAGVPPGPWEAVETDISRTIQADRAFRINGPAPEVVHLEMQSSSRLGIPCDLLRYNAILHHSTRLPVHSILMLLRPAARASDQSGTYEVRSANSTVLHTFHYHVVPIWQASLHDFLDIPGLSPLALLTDEAAQNLPNAFEQFQHRLREPPFSANVIPTLLTTTYVLCGLRYDEKNIQELYMSLSQILEDSTTYQGIIKKGFARGEAAGIAKGIAEGKAKGKAEGEATGEARGLIEEARKVLLLLGRKKFGEPAAHYRDLVSQTDDLDRLHLWIERVVDVTTWDDVFATP